MGRTAIAARHSKWQAIIFAVLLATADAGFQELRESALRGDLSRRIEASANDAESQDAVVAKAIRAVEQAQQVAQRAVQNVVRHNRRGSSFAETALSADSKALTADGGLMDAGEPISAGIIIVMTITSMIMKVINSAEKARLDMLQGKYSETVQTILDETSDAVKAMTRNYEEVFGEATRQVGDLVREMGVATVNLLKDEQAIEKAAKQALDKYAAVKAPSSSDVEATELHNRYYSSPAISELKAAYSTWEKAKTDAGALMALRKALAKVVASDYALIHSLGDIRGKGKYGPKLAQYVYAVDPTAMKKLFKLALASTPVLSPMLQEEIKVEAAMRRMSFNSMAQTYTSAAGKDSENTLAAQRDANLVLLDSKGSLVMQLPETEGRGDAISEIKEYVDGLVDVAENGVKVTEAVMKALNGGELADATGSALDLADKIVSGVHAAVAIIGVIANIMSAVKLYKVEKQQDLEFYRDSGVFSERHTHATRRGMATTCRLFDSLRAPLTAMINTPITDIAATDAQLQARGAKRTDLSSALGLDALLGLSPNAKRRISVTMAVRFCAIFQPMLARIEELFTPRGECAQELQSTDMSNNLKQITGSPDMLTTVTIRDTSVQLLGLAKPPQLVGHQLTYPRVETCLKDDIYDIQVAKDSAAATAFKALGYAPMNDIDQNWVAPGDHFLVFKGEINRKAKVPKKAGEEAEAVADRFTQVFVLTCEALHTAVKTLGCEGPKHSDHMKEDICKYFNALRFPVTDVTFAYRTADMTDDKLPQLQLHKAGYQMLYLNKATTPKDLAQNLKKDLDDSKAPTPPALTKAKIKQDYNIRRRGSKDDDEKKSMVTMHILRGGMTPLQDIRLAPFVSVSQAGGDYTHKGDADSLTQPFCVQNAAYSLKTSTSYILPTRWYKVGTVLPNPISQSTGSIQGGVLSMVAPPECKNPVDVTTMIDKPWMKKNLWQMVRGKEGTEATTNFVKHAFDSRCEFDANKAIWERVAASPYPDNESNAAKTQKPYLWVKRRYAIPPFEVSKPNAVAACPWECSGELKGVVMPPSSLLTSPSALKTLRDKEFNIDSDFQIGK